MGLGFGVWVAILSWVRRGTEIRGFCSFSLGFSMDWSCCIRDPRRKQKDSGRKQDQKDRGTTDTAAS